MQEKWHQRRMSLVEPDFICLKNLIFSSSRRLIALVDPVKSKRITVKDPLCTGMAKESIPDDSVTTAVASSNGEMT